MSLKVWTIHRSLDGGEAVPVEVVEKAEYDKLKSALEEINDLMTWVVEDSKEIIRKALND
jgi:tetrahydromethanopterin S-methyltransferase subunit G